MSWGERANEAEGLLFQAEHHHEDAAERTQLTAQAQVKATLAVAEALVELRAEIGDQASGWQAPG